MSTTFTFPTLETERLKLRVPRFEDFDGVDALLASERSRFLGGPVAARRLRWRSFGHIAGMWMLRGYGTFVLERKSDGRAVGSCGPWHPIDWPEREIGWSIWHAEEEGKGYITEAGTKVLDWVFGDLGWDTCVSYIDAANHPSAAVARRLGASPDPDAQVPEGDEHEPLHVWRHPARIV